MYGEGYQNTLTSYGSGVENGQLVPVLMNGQVFPSQAYVPYFQGRGAPTPTLPPPVSIGGSHNSWSGNFFGENEAISDPWSAAKSPVVWAIGFLIIGILGLRHVHWRG